MAQANLTPLGFRAQGFDPFSVLRREMEQLFDGVMRGGAAQEGSAGTVVAPRIDVSEEDREIRITAELPGMKPDDVSVTIDDDVLTIRAEREQEREAKRRDYHLIERSIGVFQRTLRLPFPVDPGQVQARMENGLLTISIPKNESRQRAHRVEVTSGQREGGDGQGSGSSAAGGSSSEGGGSGGQPAHH